MESIKDKKHVKEINEVVKDIIEKGEAIIVTGSGISCIKGPFQHVSFSIAFLLNQLYREDREKYDSVMDDLKFLNDKSHTGELEDNEN